MKKSDQWQVTSDDGRYPRRLENLATYQSSVVTQKAFTLVEIMVAVAVFSIIIAAIYSTWILVLRSSKVGQEAAAQVQRQRIAIRTIEDSLSCIQSFQASMQYYSFIVQNGDQPVLSFTSRLPDIFPRNGRFQGFNLRRLTFTIEPGADNEKNLVLRQNPILMDMDSDEQSYPLVLARNVKDFVVECWDTNAMDWAEEWDDTNSIPTMVRVTLTLGDKLSAGIPLIREIAVPSSTLPTVAQTGGGVGGGGGINLNGRGEGGGGNNPNGGGNRGSGNRGGGNGNGGNGGNFNPGTGSGNPGNFPSGFNPGGGRGRGGQQ
jgi:type II secretion system protein J